MSCLIRCLRSGPRRRSTAPTSGASPVVAPTHTQERQIGHDIIGTQIRSEKKRRENKEYFIKSLFFFFPQPPAVVVGFGIDDGGRGRPRPSPATPRSARCIARGPRRLNVLSAVLLSRDRSGGHRPPGVRWRCLPTARRYAVAAAQRGGLNRYSARRAPASCARVPSACAPLRFNTGKNNRK